MPIRKTLSRSQLECALLNGFSPSSPIARVTADISPANQPVQPEKFHTFCHYLQASVVQTAHSRCENTKQLAKGDPTRPNRAGPKQIRKNLSLWSFANTKPLSLDSSLLHIVHIGTGQSTHSTNSAVRKHEIHQNLFSPMASIPNTIPTPCSGPARGSSTSSCPVSVSH